MSDKNSDRWMILDGIVLYLGESRNMVYTWPKGRNSQAPRLQARGRVREMNATIGFEVTGSF